jgi:hypothetical protein
MSIQLRHSSEANGQSDHQNIKKTKLRGLSLQANYTDRVTAAYMRC